MSYLLCIDIGNTTTVFGVFEGKSLKASFRVETRREATHDELGILFLNFLKHFGIEREKIRDGIVSCVVPSILKAVSDMAGKYLSFKPLVVSPGIRTGMPILYDNPREVGADRVVNGVAAYARYRSGVIVVDFGTATTFDCISGKGEYLGGVITLGFEISAEALFKRTSKLPRVEMARPARVIGKDTISSIQSGLFFGYLDMVEGIIRRLKGEMGRDVHVIATGGMAHLFAGESEEIEEVDDDLTLEGLRLIYELNRG